MNNKHKICFLSLDGYSLYNKRTQYNFGGAELRTSLIAKVLSENRDFEISVITGYHPHSKLEDGEIKLLKSSFYSLVPGIGYSFRRMLKKLFYKLFYVKKKYNEKVKDMVFNEANADTYCGFSLNKPNQELINFCKRNKKKYIHFIASDSHVDSQKRKEFQQMSKIASIIFVQNTYQHDRVKNRYLGSLKLINNPIQLERTESIERKTILWVGKDNKVKNPSLFLKIVEQYPNHQFEMVCNQLNESYSFEYEQYSNLIFHSFVSSHEIEKLFSKAKLFISTSIYEGFPNTFLQAGKYDVPVLSLIVNPNNYLTENDCGIVVGKNRNFKDVFDSVVANDFFPEKGKNHRDYLMNNHDIRIVGKEIENCLKKFL